MKVKKASRKTEREREREIERERERETGGSNMKGKRVSRYKTIMHS